MPPRTAADLTGESDEEASGSVLIGYGTGGPDRQRRGARRAPPRRRAAATPARRPRLAGRAGSR